MLSLKFIAIMLGALIIATRLPGIFNPKALIKVFKSYLKDDKFMRAFSLLPFGLGLAIIMVKPMFTYDLTLLMSVFGWLMLVVSLYMMWEPEMLEKRALKILKNTALVQVLCTIAVLLGALLIYLGIAVY